MTYLNPSLLLVRVRTLISILLTDRHNRFSNAGIDCKVNREGFAERLQYTSSLILRLFILPDAGCSQSRDSNMQSRHSVELQPGQVSLKGAQKFPITLLITQNYGPDLWARGHGCWCQLNWGRAPRKHAVLWVRGQKVYVDGLWVRKPELWARSMG